MADLLNISLKQETFDMKFISKVSMAFKGKGAMEEKMTICN
jgi:hypothetical protein